MRKEELSKYRHLFFDLDHTLWDYDANAGEALRELHQKYEMETRSGFTASELIRSFLDVNDILWDDFNLQRIGRDELRERRFPMIYETLNAPMNEIPNGIETEYVSLCPTKKSTFPFAHELLTNLVEHFGIHLITNGFDEIQGRKLRSSGLLNYFDVIVTSETAGFRKPDPRIFEYALNKAGADTRSSLMIGDNLIADIGGAREYGIDQVLFNPKRTAHNDQVTYEIDSLEQLLELL